MSGSAGQVSEATAAPMSTGGASSGQREDGGNQMLTPKSLAIPASPLA